MLITTICSLKLTTCQGTLFRLMLILRLPTLLLQIHSTFMLKDD